MAQHGGASATVHTSFALGNGVFLDQDTVLAARHVVLTPGGLIDDRVGVGFTLPPINNIMETESVAVAQDPEHDLVLLRLQDGALGPPAAEEHCADAASPRLSRAVARARHKRRRHHRERPRAALPVRADAHTRSVPLRIVWDGPLARSL